jgi:hypothetical protein
VTGISFATDEDSNLFAKGHQGYGKKLQMVISPIPRGVQESGF